MAWEINIGAITRTIRKRRNGMTVKELVTKLGEYNQSADVKVVVHNIMSDFDITFGTSEGSEKETCDTVFLNSYLFHGESEKSS